MDKHTGEVIIPKERRKKEACTKGEMDNDGFYRTPNGSFWDCDGEYFNRHGYDIHGGSYMNVLDYVPGPTWLQQYGCYPEEKEIYLQDDNDFDEFCDDDNNEEDCDFKGDENDLTEEDYAKLGISKEELTKAMNKSNPITITNTNTNSTLKTKNKTKTKVKTKSKTKDEEEWEECDDD